MELDREIKKSLGDLYPYPARIPRILIETLKERGYNVSKLIRIKLLEVVMEEENDDETLSLFQAKLKELQDD